MRDKDQKRGNSVLWLGLLLIVLGVLSNALYFVPFPATIVPWINVALPALGVILLVIGVTRAYGHPEIFSGKIWGSFVTVISMLVLAGSLWLLWHTRDVPQSKGAPQVGQIIPDFTLPDSAGQPVSLAQLFAGTPATEPSRAVLLVFYRGYW